MKTKTALKWTIGVIAVVILMAVGAVVLLFVAFIVSMERGEKHQRQIRAEQDSGKWDFGDQPALFAVAQGIVKNDPDAIHAAGKAVPAPSWTLKMPAVAVTESVSFHCDVSQTSLKLRRTTWTKPTFVRSRLALYRNVNFAPTLSKGRPRIISGLRHACAGFGLTLP